MTFLLLAVIDFAAQCNYKLSVRSGGHQYSGYSSCEVGTKCIQVDVLGLKAFHYDESNNLATLGAGLTIQEVAGNLAYLGLVLPMGICNSVGIGGHLQSSSLGFFAASFGSGMDLVRSFRIVSSDCVTLLSFVIAIDIDAIPCRSFSLSHSNKRQLQMALFRMLPPTTTCTFTKLFWEEGLAVGVPYWIIQSNQFVLSIIHSVQGKPKAGACIQTCHRKDLFTKWIIILTTFCVSLVKLPLWQSPVYLALRS